MVGGGIDGWKLFHFVGVADGWIFFWLMRENEIENERELVPNLHQRQKGRRWGLGLLF